MKTIRHNTFETNSSSTHAYTVSVPAKNEDAASTFIPKDGKLEFCISAGVDGENNLFNRVNFLLNFADVTQNEEAFKMVVETIEEFCNCKVNVTHRVYKNQEWVTLNDYKIIRAEDHDVHDAVSDTFYSFLYDSDAETFIEENNKIFEDKEKIKTFIFGRSDRFNTESYYDG